MQNLFNDEKYLIYISGVKIPGVNEAIVDIACYREDLVKRVYYTNSIQGGHARVILELANKKHISFSYGQAGAKNCFLKEGVLAIELFKHFPDAVPGIREIEYINILDPLLSVEKSIGIAKLIFQTGEFINFNYWTKNCYIFADNLYNELTGDNFSKIDWFISEVSKGNKWVKDPSILESVYGPCPYK